MRTLDKKSNTMLLKDFETGLIDRLSLLQEEVKAYPSDELFQAVAPGTTNSAEVLCKHIIGNLHWFVGAQLGGTGYVRDRDSEFVSTGYTTETLYDSLEDTKDMVRQTLNQLWNEDLTKTYPILFKDREVTVHFMLLTVITHLDYHRGQIDYHRRIEW